MKLNASVLFVTDIEASKQFYTEVLELEIIDDFGTSVSLNQNIALWAVGDEHPVNVHLDNNKYVNRTELYFEEEDIEQCYQRIRQCKVKFFQDIQEEPWGQRNFRFFDPDNHLIEVGEPVPVFVANMKANGMINKAISEKTGIPLQSVEKMIRE